MNRSIANINGVVEQTVTSTREIATASQQLRELTRELRDLIARFRV